MLWRLMKRCEQRQYDLTHIGIPVLLLGIFVVTVGTHMNRAFDSGSNAFFGVPLNEMVCVVVLVIGSVLMGMSIVFNVVGLRERCGRQ